MPETRRGLRPFQNCRDASKRPRLKTGPNKNARVRESGRVKVLLTSKRTPGVLLAPSHPLRETLFATLFNGRTMLAKAPLTILEVLMSRTPKGKTASKLSEPTLELVDRARATIDTSLILLLQWLAQLKALEERQREFRRVSYIPIGSEHPKWGGFLA